MDWLEFTSSIVSSVAWPLAFVTAAVVFKNPLQELLKRMTDVELWGSKATFASELKKAEKTAHKIRRVSGKVGTAPAIARDDEYLKLAERYPGAAVLQSFKKVEAVLDEWQDAQGMTHPPTNEGFVQWLVQDGYLSDEEYELYKSVLRTRNIAVHDFEKSVSTGEALAYRDLCDKVVSYLNRAIDGWNKGQNKPKPTKATAK